MGKMLILLCPFVTTLGVRIQTGSSMYRVKIDDLLSLYRRGLIHYFILTTGLCVVFIGCMANIDLDVVACNLSQVVGKISV